MHYWNSVLNEVLHKNNFELLDDIEASEFDNESDLKESRDLRMYYLTPHYPDVYFTRREAECFFWVVQGFTLSQAAFEMGLSSRTVEFYMRNMKLKLQCTSKKDLLDKVLQSSLLQQLERHGMRIVRH